MNVGVGGAGNEGNTAVSSGGDIGGGGGGLWWSWKQLFLQVIFDFWRPLERPPIQSLIIV